MTDPEITIGLCVRNGAAHLAEAIESFLAQTRGDFELIVYDNASTDATPAIAARYAALDPRVRMVRRERDIGMAPNFVDAAERARTPCFTWAAADDRREPDFLAALLGALEEDPGADGAACAARDLAPDGGPGPLRPETAWLDGAESPCPGRRLVAFFKRAPCTPFYGVFRTAALRDLLATMRAMSDPPWPLPIGGDVVALATFLAVHRLRFVPRPLLLLRCGGASHDPNVYGDIETLPDQMRRFARRLRDATAPARLRPADRMRVRLARWRYLGRLLVRPPMSATTWRYLAWRFPILRPLHARLLAAHHPAFARLRHRALDLPAGSRIVLYGAGKHTRRCRSALERAVGKRRRIVGVCDDAAPALPPIDGERVLAPGAAGALLPEVILVSSDAAEPVLFRRARAIAGPGTAVWALYDTNLERHAAEEAPSAPTACSEASTPARNASIPRSAVSTAGAA